MAPAAERRGHRTVAFDPHVHTVASYDCATPVEDVLRAASAAGLDAVAITDHDVVDGATRALDRASSVDVTVVPGVEVSTAAGHLLALGVESCPAVGRPLEETVAWVRERGGVAVVPHPFQVSRHGVRKRALADCDALEVYNAMAMTGLQNARARAAAAARDLPRLGASDAHSAAMVGRAYSEVSLSADAPVTVESVLDAVRTGRVRPAGETVPRLRYLAKLARSAGVRTASLRPSRLFRADH